MLAARGRRELADARSHERLAGAFLVTVRHQARKVWIETVVTAGLVTAAAVAVAASR